MLSAVDRNGRPVRLLNAAEVEAMLAAFARPGATALARTRGADVVRKTQKELLVPLRLPGRDRTGAYPRPHALEKIKYELDGIMGVGT